MSDRQKKKRRKYSWEETILPQMGGAKNKIREGEVRRAAIGKKRLYPSGPQRVRVLLQEMAIL